MQQVALNRIKVNPSERQREVIGDIEQLAASIQEFGQLQPILLDEDFNLVAGFRRLTAVAALGHDTVGCEFLGKLTKLRGRQIELEENVRRKQLEWQEEQRAIDELHKLKMEEDPTWSADKTAAMLGKSRRTVYNAIELTKALGVDPEIAKADTPYGAMLRLKHSKQIEERKEEAQVRQQREKMGLSQKVQVTVVQGDALELIQGLPDESMDLAITNPPYGVEIESLFKGEKAIYTDEKEAVVALLGGVFKEIYRVLRPDRWFVTFYPTARLEEGKQLLAEAGFKFQAVPCIWYKPNKFLSSLSQPYQNFSIQYETFFWGRKGEPRFNKLRTGNVFVCDTPESNRLHPLQMPPDLWKEIIEIGSVTGEHILEPFAGSGSGGIAALRMERNYLGIELSTEYVERANTWLSEERSGAAKERTLESDLALLKALEFST